MDLFIISFVVNFFSTAFMTGVIWLVQLINYPLLKLIDPKEYTKYHSEHIQRITPLVAPIMIIELFSSLFLIIWIPMELAEKDLFYPLLMNFALVIII